MTATGDAASGRTTRADSGTWRVVAGQECRDLWVSGRGPWLLFGFSVLLSAVTYLTASNLVLNFLEQREATNLVLQVAVAVGVLVALVVSADGISGERERGTLEGLLLTPLSRRAILAGKFVAAVSVWWAAFVVSIPYVWVLARDVSIAGPALLLGLLVGTLLAIGLVAMGLLISALSNSNKVSLAISFLLLLALFTPTQLPRLPQGWAGELLGRANPVRAGMQYLTAVLVHGHGWTQDGSYLVSPLLTAVLAGGALVVTGARIVRLTAGVSGQ
jgi:ABC-2 type transport system permease protein